VGKYLIDIAPKQLGILCILFFRFALKCGIKKDTLKRAGNKCPDSGTWVCCDNLIYENKQRNY
jgi:hypothetical protein